MFLYHQNETNAQRRQVYLHLVSITDGISPALSETGGQPQISVNGGAFVNTISTLVAVGNGLYYVQLNVTELATFGFSVVRYKSAATAEAQVCFEIVDFDPFNLVASLVQAMLNTDISTVEAATPPKHSLYTAVAKSVNHTHNSGTAVTVFRTDGVTTHATQTVTTDPTLQPISDLTGAV